MSKAAAPAGAAPDRSLSPARLAEALTFDSGEAVAVLYGPGATDLFCCADLLLRPIDGAILYLLKAAGYQRVVFCTLDGLYHLDADSATAAQAPQTDTPPSGRLRRFGGPRGAQDALAEPVAAPARPARSMADPFKVKQMHALMTGSGPRTAVVVLRAEDFLHHNVAARELTDRIGEWLAYGTASRHLALLVFSNGSLEEVVAAVDRNHTQGTLLAFLRGRPGGGRQRAVGRIGRPDEGELIRLVHRTRLHDGLAIADWTQLPRIVASMAARDDSIKDWQLRLTRLGGRPLSGQVLREHGWIESATSDGRSAWDRLDELTGLGSVKEHIRSLAVQARSRRARPRRSARSLEPPSLHLVFSGNPGTGKTTVARLLAEIYHDIGLIRFNKLHAVEGPDLVAQYVGQTAPLTNAAVDAALGGVLLIDEAYRLTAPDRGGFGQEAVDTLVTRLENDRDRFVAIVAGYRAQMEQFVAANPGLATRFETTIHFPDYEPEELLEIVLGMLDGQHLTWDDAFTAAMRAAVEQIHRQRDPTNFGNAREMRKLANEIDQRWSARVGSDYAQLLAVSDIPERYHAERPAADCWARLDELTGLDTVKRHLRRLARQVESLRLRPVRSPRALEPGSPHLIFSGNPGTGKTTVARLMAQAYHDIGVLRSDKLHSVEASDLVAGYIGQTAIRTNAAVDAALGGVLFIDEAYRLCEDGRGGFGQEAIDTLVSRLEDNRDAFVVIAAGYPASMLRFRTSNPGLPSRFPQRNIVEFPDYTPDELLAIVLHMLEGRSLTWDDAFTAALHRAVDRIYLGRDEATFGNAREMRELADEIDQNWSNRVGPPYEDALAVEDLPPELCEPPSPVPPPDRPIPMAKGVRR
jgi:SpoVK/Ycf46/Vps4 family AAA+-type ATPase